MNESVKLSQDDYHCINISEPSLTTTASTIPIYRHSALANTISMDSSSTAGGFEHPFLLSPPHSSIASGSTAHATLPHAREHPLKSGGSKESSFIRFVDQGIQKIQRRFAKRGSNEADKEEKEDAKGYANFPEFAKDTEALIDLVWVSGTRKCIRIYATKNTADNCSFARDTISA